MGFCNYHKVYVTAKQARFKQCAAKHCNALIKTDHPYWRERELKKQLRKLRKESGRLSVKQDSQTEEQTEANSEVSFELKCVELYASATNRSLTSVYEMFFTTGLHEKLTAEKERLSTINSAELIGFCDDFIQNYARNIR